MPRPPAHSPNAPPVSGTPVVLGGIPDDAWPERWGDHGNDTRHVLALIANGHSTADACAEAGVDEAAWHAALRANLQVQADYDWAVRQGERRRIEAADDALWKRGVKGWKEPVYYRGEQLGTVRKFSDTAAKTWLTAHDPRYVGERDRDRAVVVVLNLSGFTGEQAAQLTLGPGAPYPKGERTPIPEPRRT